MKSTFILTNNGDNPSAVITLQISYFVKPNETIQVEVQEFALTVKSNQGTAQEVDFGTLAAEDQEVLIIVQKPKGNIITQKSFILKKIVGQQQQIEFTINNEIDLNSVPSPNVDLAKPSFTYGRLLDRKGIASMEDIQIIFSVKKGDSDAFEPVTSIKTEAQGYFSIEYPIGDFKEAVALVGLELSNNPIPMKLDEKIIKVTNERGDEEEKTILVFPKRVILIAELIENVSPKVGDKDCSCKANEFGDKRVLEEFSFYSLVRTSEPAIKGYVLEDEDEITLEDVLKNLPISVFELIEPIKALPFIIRESPVRSIAVNTTTVNTNTRATRARTASNDDDFLETIKTIKINKSVLNNFLKEEKTITKDNITKLFTQNEILKFQNVLNDKPSNPRPLGRVELGVESSIDWDDEPTIYQAVEVAHGHLLQ
ncbi:MAG TPA: hypothetical protein PLD02_16215, partial [Saprospiraceae bacterium]|nr:hypothetical protein [Saprospiraceae bacterium]